MKMRTEADKEVETEVEREIITMTKVDRHHIADEATVQTTALGHAASAQSRDRQQDQDQDQDYEADLIRIHVQDLGHAQTPLAVHVRPIQNQT